MNKIFLFFTLLLLFAACKTEPKQKESISIADVAPIEKTQGIAKVYQLQTVDSKILWVGSKKIAKHNGSIKISEGKINVLEGNITSGDFDIDLKSIIVSDLKGNDKTSLEESLSGKDFFESQKFPIARFIIKKAEKIENQPNATHKMTGDLTIKEISKTIEFLAQINITENEITAKSQPITISRSAFGIRDESSLLDMALDKAIQDNIEVSVELKCKAN